jgi:flagellar basal-body rod protein FlgC
MFDSLDISASALTAQRTRLDTIAANIANMNTTSDAAGRNNPYRRRFAVFAPGQSDDPTKAGVHVKSVDKDLSPFRKEYRPDDPRRDKDGYVSFPNVQLEIEYVNALEASRAYEANVTTMEVSKAMFNASLRLIA